MDQFELFGQYGPITFHQLEWSNKIQGKIYHQLREAHDRQARKIWVFNVGDIKPLEIPLTFAMEMAWNIDSVQADSIPQYLGTLASRSFGPDLSLNIASAWHDYDRLVSLRKHEHIELGIFSCLHYNEADEIVRRWKTLESNVDQLYQKISERQKPGFWELVVHPVKASSIFTQLRVTQTLNQLYARQRRNAANKLFRQALDLFDADFKLSQEFHSLLNGKWNHIMCQPHMGYGDTWHAPSRDAIFGLAYVQRGQNSNPIVGQMGVAVEGHEGIRAGRINEESERTHPSRRDLVPGLTLGSMSRYGPTKRWFEIFTRGTPIIHWTASAPYPWVGLSVTEGILHPDGDDTRVWITIDWDQVPVGFDDEILISVSSKEGDFEHVHLPVQGHEIPDAFNIFVEADGCVSIPASGLSVPASYQHHPDLGRSKEGTVVILSTTLQGHSAPFLEYPFYVFTSTTASKIILYFNMTLDIDPTNPMTYDIAVDSHPVERHALISESKEKKKLPAEGWLEAVMDCAWKRDHMASLSPGMHTIRIRLNHSNILLEKIVVDLGGVKESYLGPPASFCVLR
jgi:hypothetical protein